MMTYGELDLKKLREDNDLDFAHYTYRRGMCSCCYGPEDLAAKYWRNKQKPARMTEEHQTLLFKNADNGNGHVTAKDTICVLADKRGFGFPRKYRVCIEWNFPREKLDGVCRSLRDQLDQDYLVLKPLDDMHCIQIAIREGFYMNEFDAPMYEVFE